MKLVDLEPQFLHWDPANWPDKDGIRTFQEVDTLAEANGIFFVCPKCLADNGMHRPGVHGVECWNPSVPLGEGLPGPGRWSFEGTGYHDLSLVAASSSVKLEGGCGAHFFVKNGEIT
jgi:hypothetical protein